MKKQMLSVSVAACMALSLTPATAFAATPEEAASSAVEAAAVSDGNAAVAVDEVVDGAVSDVVVLSDEAGNAVEAIEETPEASTSVAEVNGQAYDSLQGAIDASNGEVVKLTSDIALDAQAVVSSEVAIDLNGHKLTRGDTNKTADLVRVNSKGALTLRDSSGGNGTIESSNFKKDSDDKLYAGFAVLSQGSLTVESGTYKGYYGIVASDADSSLSMKGGTIEGTYIGMLVQVDANATIDGETAKITAGTCGVMVSGNKDATEDPTILTVNRGTISSPVFAIAGNGMDDGTKIAINGGTITSTRGVAIYHPQVGDLNIGGGTIEGAVGGVQYCGSGTLSISGGTLASSMPYSSFPSKPAEQGDGNADDGAALSLVSRGPGYQDNGGTMNVSITGGTLTSANNAAISVYRLKKIDDVWKTNSDTGIENYLNALSITGGTFTGGAQKGALEIDSAAAEALSVTAGTFGDNPLAFAKDGYVAKVNGSEYTLVEKKGLTSGTYVTKDGDAITGDDLASGYWISSSDNNTYVVAVVYVPPVTPSEPEPDKEVVTNPDGSTTTTVTETSKGSDGSTTTTVTETTEGREDGSTTEKVTETVEKADGSKSVTVTETATLADGTSATTVSDGEGNVTSVEVEVSESAAATGKVELPVAEVEAATDSDDAQEIAVKVPASVTAESPVQVTVPVAKAGDGAPVGPGTVVVVVNPDGTETVLPKTAVADGGVVVELEGDAVVKVVDNAKALPDVAPDDWFAAEVAPFATARGIVNGVPQADGGLAFEGDAPADRATFVRMLHNLELNPEAAGEGSLPDVAPTDWYADAAAWALEAGVLNGVEAPDGSKSFDGGAEVTREQMALFLMRYAQHLGLDTSARAELAFPDAGEVSGWAADAMSWAVAEGLFMGDGSTGELNPGDGATRAQVAAVMMRFINGMYA